MVGIFCNHTAQQRGILSTYIVDFELCFHFLRLVVSGQLVEHCPGPATSHHRGRRKLISSDVAVIAATRAQCRRRVPEPCAQQSRWKHIHKSHRKKGNQSVVRTCSASGILKNNRDTIPFTAIAAPLVLLLLLLLLSGLIEAWGLINYIFRTTIEDAEWMTGEEYILFWICAPHQQRISNTTDIIAATSTEGDKVLARLSTKDLRTARNGIYCTYLINDDCKCMPWSNYPFIYLFIFHCNADIIGIPLV